MQQLLLSSPDLAEFLEGFTHLMASALSMQERTVWCAVTVLRHPKAATVASNSAQAAVLDEIQASFGHGPCLQAATTQSMIYLADVHTDPRWPDYNKVAAAHGVHSILAAPFDLGAEASASLNVFTDQPRGFDEAAMRTVQHEVERASDALRLAVRLAQHRQTEEDLGAAMVSRTTIDVAVGILMGRYGHSQDEAVTFLKNASNGRNVKLRDLAEEIVRSVNHTPAATHFNHSTPRTTAIPPLPAQPANSKATRRP
ncbi:ANTAR domain-containing protein [Kocuria sabuli]|uniref:ANTAR domain-containing protein n=1 Tax=Kocuria sabuli TaxID=3071448 RepID=UPI0034D72262